MKRGEVGPEALPERDSHDRATPAPGGPREIGRERASILPPLAWLLAAAVLSAAGCGPGPDRPGDRAARVAVLVPATEKPYWEPIAGRFEREHPGARVELVEGPNSTDLRESLYTASLLARDTTFDLVYADVTWTPKFASAGWLVPLDDRIEPRERAQFLPAALAAGEFAGRLYRIPVRTDIGLLLYRADWLSATSESPPETFDDLTRVASALESSPGRWGFVWQGKQYEGLVCVFLEVLTGHGGFWVDPATEEVGLDRPEAVKALRFLRSCLRRGGISPPGVATYQEEESRRIFQDGRAVFLRNWPYAWRLSQAEGSELRGRVGVVTMVRAPEGRRAGTLGGWGLAISASSRRPDLAWDFIRAATSLEGQRDLCGPTGYAPARIEAYDDPALRSANPLLERLRELHEHAVARPAIARYALASDILQRHLSAALAGAESAEEALGRAARETRRMLGRYPSAASGPEDPS